MPPIANDAREKLRHFIDGLRLILRRDVRVAGPTTYVVVVTRALAAEQDLKDIENDRQGKNPIRHLSDSSSSSPRSHFRDHQRARDNNRRRRILRSLLIIRCVQSAVEGMRGSVYGDQKSALSVDPPTTY